MTLGPASRSRARGNTGRGALRGISLPLALVLLFSLATTLARAASCGTGTSCPKSSPCCSEFGQCGSGAQQCAGGCQALYSYQAGSCQPNPICKNLNITFKPSDYKNQDMFMPILAYDGTGSGNGGAPFTLDAGNVGQGTEGVLLQMTIGSQAKISTTDYFLYGSVQATLRHQPRQGLVAAFILMSDVKDEVDWEFTTSDGSKGFTNYFSLGQYVKGHGTDVVLPKNGDVGSWHTYGLNWTPNQLQWTIDGSVVRTLTKSQAGSQFPRTPSRVQLSTWAGGNVTSPAGTQEWAGGLIDWTNSEYKSNGYYSQEIKSYSISCADSSSAGLSTANRRASSTGATSANSATSWVYTGQSSGSGPAYQLSTAPITALKNPSADGSPAAPGSDSLSKSSISNSWNGSGVKAKSNSGGGGSGGSGGGGSLFNGGAALKYGLPIGGGIIAIVLGWAACVYYTRRKRMGTVGKNNPLGAPGTAIVGGTGMAHHGGGGGVAGGGKRTSKYAPLHNNLYGSEVDDAPMGAQRMGTGYGPAVGPRPGPMPGRDKYEMAAAHVMSPTSPSGGAGSPFGYPQASPYGAAPHNPNPSGYFPSSRPGPGQGPGPGPGRGYGAQQPPPHHAQYSSGNGFGVPYTQPAYRDY